MTAEHHTVVIDGDALACRDCGFCVRNTSWGPNLARALAHAHAANPRASTEALFQFVGESGSGAPLVTARGAPPAPLSLAPGSPAHPGRVPS